MENQLNGTPKATFYLNELAGELAELFIEMKYEGQNVPLYNIKDEDEDMLCYTDKIQDEFNEALDRIEDYLDLTKIKDDEQFEFYITEYREEVWFGGVQVEYEKYIVYNDSDFKQAVELHTLKLQGND